MRNDLVRRVDRMKAARDAAVRWEVDLASLVPVSETANFVFRFRTPDGLDRYLRLGHESRWGDADIEAELDYVVFLGRHGADVAAPVRSRWGKCIESVDTPQGRFHAVVFEAVDGEKVCWGSDAQNRALLLERGRSLGRLHRISQSYCTSGPHRLHWYEDDLFTDPQHYLSRSTATVRREYQLLITWLLKRPRTRANYGMVHGDFGSGNMLRQEDGRLVVYDFDDCCYHWYLYDLAVAIRSARKLERPVRHAYLHKLLEGYASETPLNGEGVSEVAMFCRLAALYRYVSMLREHNGQPRSPDQQMLLEDRRMEVENPVEWE